MAITSGPAPKGPAHHPTPPAGPSPAQLARAVTVVSGGPFVLAALSAVSPFSAARRWPDRLPGGFLRRAAWTMTAVGVAFPGAYAFVVRPWLVRWGSTEEERNRRLPGDAHEKPLIRVTRAVTVRAPAEEVWRWLVQIGQDRGGFYSYDWLENLAGCRIHSAETIRPELQDLAAGDELRLFPGFGTRFAEVDAPRSMVIENWGSYVVEPVDDVSCRLIARANQHHGPAAVGYVLAIELPHAVMERKMLLGIKKRAERAAASGRA